MAINQLRTLRTKARMRQADLADACGVDLSTVARWEAGTRKVPSAQLATLAKELGVELGEVLTAIHTPLEEDTPRVYVHDAA